MGLILLAYVAGVLTILSPCILPVLPFVFARANRSFLRNGLPLLFGMALTFALIASLAAVGGAWAIGLNRYGRDLALAVLALFGITLLFPQISDRLTRPLVAAGARLSKSADARAAKRGVSILPSFLLGIATGLLWAPCAGPILGLILTGAALRGASVQTTLLLLAYAAGAATSCALALLVGGRLFTAMKRSLGAGEWIKRVAGVAVLAAVVAIACGWDTGFLTRVSAARTASLEQRLLDKFHPAASAARARTSGPSESLGVEGMLPSLAGAVEWINSPPLTPESLKGKVVLVDFWTYSCVNCLRTLPYARAWAEKYKDQGLVVIGIHSPEFAFEKEVSNVRKAVGNLNIGYPVAVDNDYALWRAFNNQYWPAHYFIDAQGRIRHHHFGEGGYEESERVIQELLAEAGRAPATGLVSVNGSGAEAAPKLNDLGSPETYVGYERAEHFISEGGARRDVAHVYTPGSPRLNEWGLSGDWTITNKYARLNSAGGGIVYRFHARDLHLVLGVEAGGKPVRYRVTIDGQPPGGNHGADVDAGGEGFIDGERLYQLIRQTGSVADHTFEIRFLDPGAEAYAFTFG